MGNHWRGYVYIERATAFNHVDDPRLAEEAARAFGEFQLHLCDLPGSRLADTIPISTIPAAATMRSNTPWPQTGAGASPRSWSEIALCREREEIVDHLLDLKAESQLPERITHNDTKINNVMIDDGAAAASASWISTP